MKKQWFILISIFFISSFIVFFIIKINSNIGNSAKFELEKRIDDDLMNNYRFESINEYDINDLIRIEYDNNYITNVKYDVDQTNKLIDENIKKIKSSLIDDYIILNIPIGAILNDYYFSTIGPKIPVRIKYNKKIYINLMTKLSDYGMNNSLVELNVIVTVDYLIQSKNNITISKKYDFLLASSLIVGTVKNIYNSKYEYPYNNYTEKNA